MGRRCIRFFIYIFYLFAVDPKNIVPTNGTYNWSPGLIFGETCTIFLAGAVPGAPGARRGPRGAENRPRTRGRIYHVVLPKVCPVRYPRRFFAAAGTASRAWSV